MYGVGWGVGVGLEFALFVFFVALFKYVCTYRYMNTNHSNINAAAVGGA